MKFLILLIFLAVISCTESKPQTDSTVEADTVPDLDSAEDEISDPDKIADLDYASDESPDADVDTAVGCLDLKVQENVIKTPFPFKDKDGKPTFCRPGCDTPTETDPQCVRNIWEWDNWEKYQEYLKAEEEDPSQEWERECYPWPCELPDMKASTGGSLVSKCDRRLSVNGYKSSMGAVWTHGMSDGVAGMYLAGNAIEYDPENDKFTNVGKAMGMVSYNKNRFVVIVFESSAPDNPDYKSFVISILKKDGKYQYELIYDNEGHNAFMSNPSIVGEKWVLIQIRPGKESSVTDVKYAKVGEWEWHSLGLGKVYEGNIVGDKLTFLTPDETADRQIYYCDLSKYPKSYKECTKATRKDGAGQYEKGHSPRIDEDDENRLIYYLYEEEGSPTLIEVNYADQDNPEYKEIVVDQYMQPNKVKGNLMMSTANKGYGLTSCWYRFDKQKTYCPDSNEMMEFGTFDGKWHLWRDSIDVRIRDWECYCAETGICPFENDSDNDGLTDDKEKELGTDPGKADTDGDGDSDLEEIIAGTDPLDKDDSIPDTIEDIYVVLPYDSENTVSRTLEFTTSDVELNVMAEAVSVDNSFSIDTKGFIKSIVPHSSVPAENYDSKDETAFYGVDPQTTLNFNITFHNNIHQSSGTDHELFEININILGNGNVLDTRKVTVIIP